MHFLNINAQTNGISILEQIHQKYYQAPCKSYTFSQKNTHYRNDSVIRESEWHEAIKFPDQFRIDFGNKEDGNYVIFKNDSGFNYKKHKFIKSRSDSNTLLLILGGMFYRPFEDVVKRLQSQNYDLNRISIQKWNGGEVYVIGAKEGDLNINQIWIDKKTLRVKRIIEKLSANNTMDMRFEAHQDWCKGYIETKVSFRRNGKLEQVEEYYNIKVAEKFPD
jgi:hypothetical protein